MLEGQHQIERIPLEKATECRIVLPQSVIHDAGHYIVRAAGEQTGRLGRRRSRQEMAKGVIRIVGHELRGAVTQSPYRPKWIGMVEERLVSLTMADDFVQDRPSSVDLLWLEILV